MISCSDYSVELRRINKVFDFEYDFYDVHFKCDFEKKFIDHYYFNEIGFETIERFKHNLKAHLNLNMPYWSQLYETELAAEDLDFLLNKDYRETFLRTVDTEDKLIGNQRTNSNGSSSGTAGSTTTDSSTLGHKESAIADGVASVSLDQNFLTGVSEDKNNATSTTNSNNSNNSSNNSNEDTTEDKTGKLLEKTELVGKGNIGVTSSAELLEKWRNTIINLDRMIIESCQDLFMGVF